MTITLHQGDLPAKLDLGKTVAVDTEAMGLNNRRDRLCLVQVSSGDGMAHLVQIPPGAKSAPHLQALMENSKVCKIFHYARFDIAILKYHLGIDVDGVYCTKIASTLCRTFTDRHSLRELCRDLLDIELSKQQQSSDWGAKELTQEQMVYAANDVLHLHAIKKRLDEMLKREERLELAHKVMEFVPVRAELDLAGWSEVDIFAH